MVMPNTNCSPKRELEIIFKHLGDPEHVGHCFCITRKYVTDVFAGKIAEFPRPDYEHRIYYDAGASNYLVVRPSATGVYDEVVTADAAMKRVR